MEARRAPPGHPRGSTHTLRRRNEPGSRHGAEGEATVAPSAWRHPQPQHRVQWQVRMAGDLAGRQTWAPPRRRAARVRASEEPFHETSVVSHGHRLAPPLRPGHGSGSGGHRGRSWRQPGAEGQRAWSVKGLATPSIASSSRPPGHLSPLPAQCIQMGVSTTANVALAGPHHTAPHRP